MGIMRRSDTINELSTALTSFQKNISKIKKDKTATINTTKGSYSYTYADLASIWDAIRSNLADNGLAVIQSPSHSAGEPTLTTTVSHSSGQYIEDTMKLVITAETPQGQGSAITYARRYMLTAMLGIVAEDDNDAQDHRLASPIQKKQIWDAARKVMPDLSEQPYEMTKFITEVLGKHPSRILEDEATDAINAIQGYTAQIMGDSDVVA